MSVRWAACSRATCRRGRRARALRLRELVRHAASETCSLDRAMCRCDVTDPRAGVARSDLPDQVLRLVAPVGELRAGHAQHSAPSIARRQRRGSHSPAGREETPGAGDSGRSTHRTRSDVGSHARGRALDAAASRLLESPRTPSAVAARGPCSAGLVHHDARARALALALASAAPSPSRLRRPRPRPPAACRRVRRSGSRAVAHAPPPIDHAGVSTVTAAELPSDSVPRLPATSARGERAMPTP